MKRSEAYWILQRYWETATNEEQEALKIATQDIQFMDLMPDDMVCVVRCKDCKHRGKLYRNHLCDHPKALISNVTDMEFCSYGERRSE